MATMLTALDTFEKVLDSRHTPEDLDRAASEVARRIQGTPAVDLNQALNRLRRRIQHEHLLAVGVTAVLAGMMVEQGGDPTLTGPAIMLRIPDMLKGVASYWKRLAQRAGALPTDSAARVDLQRNWTDAIYEEDPAAVFSLMVQHGLAHGAIVHLARLKPLRLAVRAEGGYLDLAIAADEAEGVPRRLTRMLATLDDEVIDVIAEDGPPIRCVVSGISDLAHLIAELRSHLDLPIVELADPATGNPIAGEILLSALPRIDDTVTIGVIKGSGMVTAVPSFPAMEAEVRRDS